VEAALENDPADDVLWNAMGVAYLSKGARALLPGGTPADAVLAIKKGLASLERAVEINPNHAEALVTLGGMQALMASFSGNQADVAKGVAAMNRAVEISPNSTRVRLQRAFSGLNLPANLRDHSTEVEDLQFLLNLAGGMRSGEYVRILQADLFFELGNTERARQQYEIAASSGTAASDQAATRLESLKAGAINAADIRKLRQAAGSQCTMCHGAD
jgi:tetratricopeptide (TPR) repeat protein